MVALCECGCGNPVSVIKESHPGAGRIKGKYNHFVQGHNKAKKHGMSRTPEWDAFAHAKDRCTNPKNKKWPHYGGRDIKFLFTSFEEFFNALGLKPDPSLSLDRINNDGNYEAGNVRWATKKQRTQNRRKKLANQGAFDNLW